MRTVKDLQEKIERHRQNIAKYTASHSISISIAPAHAGNTVAGLAVGTNGTGDWSGPATIIVP